MNHSIEQIFTSAGWAAPAWPLLLVFTFTLVMTLFGKSIFKGFASVNTEIFQTMENQKVDESIDSYFASLDKRDRNWSIKEEENAREMLSCKMRILTNWQLRKLQNVKRTRGKTMMGTHTYDILGNNFYADYF